jgi:hypothetical protein
MEQTNICYITNIPTSSPKNKDCIEISDQIMNNLIQDNSRTYYSIECVDYEDKLGGKLHPMGFRIVVTIMFITIWTKSGN